MVEVLLNLIICCLFISVIALPLQPGNEQSEDNGNLDYFRLFNEHSKYKSWGTLNQFVQFPSFWLVGEYGDFFEGDMILDEEQMEDLFSPARNGIISTKYRWPHRTVPYRLSHKHTKEQRKYIELALSEIEKVSCLKFIRQTNEKHYIAITVSSHRLLNNPFAIRC